MTCGVGAISDITMDDFSRVTIDPSPCRVFPDFVLGLGDLGSRLPKSSICDFGIPVSKRPLVVGSVSLGIGLSDTRIGTADFPGATVGKF